MKKKVEFESSVADLAKLTKAIGHPARITIMLHLMEEGACTCQQIVDELPYSQSTVSVEASIQFLKDVDIEVEELFLNNYGLKS